MRQRHVILVTTIAFLLVSVPVAASDSDGDGYIDQFEVTRGSDPLDATSRPVIADVTDDGFVDVIDIQLVINAVLELGPSDATRDVNYDLTVNAADMQLVFNAALAIESLPIADQIALSAITIYVDWSNAGPQDGSDARPYTSIGQALMKTLSRRGDTIIVRPGTYAEHVVLSLEVKLVSDSGADVTIIRGSESGRPVLTMSDGSIVRGFSIGDAIAAPTIEVPEAANCEIANCILFGTHVRVLLSEGASLTSTNLTVRLSKFAAAYSSTLNLGMIVWAPHVVHTPAILMLLQW